MVATFLAVLELCKANRVEISGDTAEEAEIKIVTGDTKVVGKGQADGIFINFAVGGEANFPSNPLEKFC